MEHLQVDVRAVEHQENGACNAKACTGRSRTQSSQPALRVSLARRMVAACAETVLATANPYGCARQARVGGGGSIGPDRLFRLEHVLVFRQRKLAESRLRATSGFGVESKRLRLHVTKSATGSSPARCPRGSWQPSGEPAAAGSWILASLVYPRQEPAQVLEFLAVERRVLDYDRSEENHQLAFLDLFVAERE